MSLRKSTNAFRLLYISMCGAAHSKITGKPYLFLKCTHSEQRRAYPRRHGAQTSASPSSSSAAATSRETSPSSSGTTAASRHS